MTKKQTKEAAEKAKLLQRVSDIYSGACSRNMYASEYYADAKELIRILSSVYDIFIRDYDDEIMERRKHLVTFWYIDRYATPETATDFLFDNGIRA